MNTQAQPIPSAPSTPIAEAFQALEKQISEALELADRLELQLSRSVLAPEYKGQEPPSPGVCTPVPPKSEARFALDRLYHDVGGVNSKLSNILSRLEA